MLCFRSWAMLHPGEGGGERGVSAVNVCRRYRALDVDMWVCGLRGSCCGWWMDGWFMSLVVWELDSSKSEVCPGYVKMEMVLSVSLHIAGSGTYILSSYLSSLPGAFCKHAAINMAARAAYQPTSCDVLQPRKRASRSEASET